MLVTFVLQVIWSVSSLTQWFNFFLTDGIATAVLVACIGSYANQYVSLQAQNKEGTSKWWWLSLFVHFGMASFSLRPAFAFIVPSIAILMMNRAMFSWRRIAAVVVGTVLLVTAHFSFAKYWYGQHPKQLGGVLTALVFDLPVSNPCPMIDVSDLCNTQRALELFIQALRGARSAQEQFFYKIENNGYVLRTAIAAVRGTDPNL
jgi:hypothetical protein